MNERIEKLLEQVQVNEQVRRLAEQAGCAIDRLGYGEGNLEKFAELIVKECMLICRRHPSRNLDNNWDADAVAPDLVRQFEEHFGVEE